MKEKAAKWAIWDAELDRDEAPLVKELLNSGIQVSSVWDLVNTKESYPEAITVLVKHLVEYEHHPKTREGIVRALSVPESRGIAFDALYNEFVSVSVADNSDIKWLLGGALAEATTPTNKSELDRVIELIRDSKHGEGREFLIFTLEYLPKKRKKGTM